MQVLDAEPGVVPSGIVRAADLQHYDVDRQAAAGDEARNVRNIGRHDVVGATGKKSPTGAGATQGGDRDIRMTGGEAVAEGQRKEHAESRATFRLSVKQLREEQRLGGRFGPADRLAPADQSAKIERIRRYRNWRFQERTMPRRGWL